jgi:hypothetical protein
MYTSPDRIGQLARDHHHEMIAAAAARRRLPRAERSRPAPRIPLTRRLVAAFARSTPAPTR